jgi:phosphoserine phosphatase
MKTKIYLIRHGETDWNKEGRFQGCTDIKLAPEGIQQAKQLKEALTFKFDVVLASPLSRALQTAEIISEDYENFKPTVLPDLREINFGEWEGLTINQIREQFPSEYHSWRNDEINGSLMGGDLTLRNASNRAKDAILKAIDENNGKKIAIVAHGGILKAALIGIFDWKMTMYHHFFLGNTSVTEINIGDNQNPILITLNNTSHLKED